MWGLEWRNDETKRIEQQAKVQNVCKVRGFDGGGGESGTKQDVAVVVEDEEERIHHPRPPTVPRVRKTEVIKTK